MNFYIGVTDKQWFDFLAQKKPDEINFWRPTATQSFRSLEPFEMFLFKLHSPYNYIVGGGFFVTYSALPISLAWKSFEEKNGAPDFINQLQSFQTLDPFSGNSFIWNESKQVLYGVELDRIDNGGVYIKRQFKGSDIVFPCFVKEIREKDKK